MIKLANYLIFLEILITGTLLNNCDSSAIGVPDVSEKMKCHCAIFEGTNQTVIPITKENPLTEKILQVPFDCSDPNDGNEMCLDLCKALASISKEDPDAPNRLCKHLGYDIIVDGMNIYYKGCCENFMFTGISIPKTLCCRGNKSESCDSLNM